MLKGDQDNGTHITREHTHVKHTNVKHTHVKGLFVPEEMKDYPRGRGAQSGSENKSDDVDTVKEPVAPERDMRPLLEIAMEMKQVKGYKEETKAELMALMSWLKLFY